MNGITFIRKFKDPTRTRSGQGDGFEYGTIIKSPFIPMIGFEILTILWDQLSQQEKLGKLQWILYKLKLLLMVDL